MASATESSEALRKRIENLRACDKKCRMKKVHVTGCSNGVGGTSVLLVCLHFEFKLETPVVTDKPSLAIKGAIVCCSMLTRKLGPEPHKHG